MLQLSKKYRVRCNAGSSVLTYDGTLTFFDDKILILDSPKFGEQILSFSAIINFEVLK